MSTESRLRSALMDAAEEAMPAMLDTDSMLERSLQVGTRRIRIRRFSAVIAVAALVGAAAIAGPRFFNLANDEPPVPPADSPAPAPAANFALYGGYEARIEGGRDLRFAQGRWTITFHRDGRFEVGYPPDSTDSDDGPGGPAPYFSATEDRVVIPSAGLNCTDRGEYEWEIDPDGSLHLSALEDPCAHRVRVLTFTSWTPLTNEG